MKENIIQIEDLERIILGRKAQMPEGSYVASLFKKGTDRIAQKVGEEGVEVALAATRLGITGQGEKELVGEVTDLWFHSLVLLAQLNIPYLKVMEELTKRHAEKTLKGGDENGKNKSKKIY